MNLKKMECGLDSTGSEYSLMAASFEHDNEHSSSKRGKQFPDQWSYYWLLKDSFNAVSYIICPCFYSYNLELLSTFNIIYIYHTSCSSCHIIYIYI